MRPPRLALPCALALAAGLAAAGAAASPAARRCDRDVAFFQASGPGAPQARIEWRLFDPADGSDRVLLALPERIESPRWDAKFRHVMFASDGWIQRMPWAWGAQPVRLERLPQAEDVSDWWFNPDSSRWQAAAGREVGETLVGGAMLQRWWFGLWQSAGAGEPWRLIHADTLTCDEDACTWPWTAAPFARRERDVPLASLAHDAAADAWIARSRALDTTRVKLPGAGPDRAWRLRPLRSVHHASVAFRALANGERLVSRPFYLVDPGHGTSRLLPDPASPMESWVPELLAERAGLLLVPGGTGAPFVVDGATGQVLFSRQELTSGAAWVPRPRPHP